MKFDVKRLRSHIRDCLLSGKIKPFPLLNNKNEKEDFGDETESVINIRRRKRMRRFMELGKAELRPRMLDREKVML